MKDHDSQPLSDFIEYTPDDMKNRARAFYEDIKRRHSIRQFSDRPVDRSVIEDCIRAGGTAPSGANHQPWFFGCISDPATKLKVRQAAEEEERAFYGGRAPDDWLEALGPLGTDDQKPYLENAPWLIAIFAQRRGGPNGDEDLKNYYVNESVGIATGFLIAGLHCAGLATLTHTPKPMSFLNDICSRPKNEKPYLLLVTGYPAEDATVPKHALIKKPMAKIVSWI
jgi:iodotyrosine deiodinase